MQPLKKPVAAKKTKAIAQVRHAEVRSLSSSSDYYSSEDSLPDDDRLNELQRRLRETLAETLGGLDDTSSIEVVFRAIDHDGSGSLDVDELRSALDVLGIGTSEAECAALFSRLDADHTGSIDVGRICAIHSR